MSTAVEGSFVGVRLGEETNLTICATGGKIFAKGDKVVIDHDPSPAYGWVEQSPMPIFKPCQKVSARRILRLANDNDVAAYERQIKNQFNAKRFCRERAKNLELQMKVSKVDFTLDGKSATVYFTADAWFATSLDGFPPKCEWCKSGRVTRRG
jgi:cell fate regulator YaaT (PSP1 superfamily)